MIAQLVIRGHYRRRNVTSAEKLSRYWSRVHSWDAGLSHVKFACEATVLTITPHALTGLQRSKLSLIGNSALRRYDRTVSHRRTPLSAGTSAKRRIGRQ